MGEFTDVVVVVPGIMGSTLERHGEPVWAMTAGAAIRAVRTLGGSLRDLQLPAGLGDDAPDDGVLPGTVMPDLHVIPGLWTAQHGYSELVSWLRRRFGLVSGTEGGGPSNLVPFAYDWRLSNRYNARLLKTRIEDVLGRWRAQGGPYADARVVFICHSMGGLVARWYVQREGGAEVTRKLITIATPHRGSLDALEHLVHGIRKGPSFFALDLTAFARSLPSLHQLLPEYACIETPDGLAKIHEVGVADLDATLAADGRRFHDELDEVDAWWSGDVDVHVVRGQLQTTSTTARVSGGDVVVERTILGRDEAGDGTVPSLAAVPKGLRPDSPLIRHVTGRHGALQFHEGVRDELEGILTATPVVHRGGEVPIDVSTDDVVVGDAPVTTQVRFPEGGETALVAELLDDRGAVVDSRRPVPADGGFVAQLSAPSPGAYEVSVHGYGAAAATITPVRAGLFVWDAGP